MKQNWMERFLNKVCTGSTVTAKTALWDTMRKLQDTDPMLWGFAD